MSNIKDDIFLRFFQVLKHDEDIPGEIVTALHDLWRSDELDSRGTLIELIERGVEDGSED